MADYACTYTLTTSGGTIVFNDGTLGQGSSDDLYWLNVVHGLDGPVLRHTMKDKPFDHGGLAGRSWKGPRHPAFEGRIIVQSAIGNARRAIFNDMEADLRAALDSILAPTTGTLAWTPLGDSAKSLAVVCEVPVDVSPEDAYQTRAFNFGLFAAAADY